MNGTSGAADVNATSWRPWSKVSPVPLTLRRSPDTMARPAVILALVAFVAALLLAPALAQNKNQFQMRERARR